MSEQTPQTQGQQTRPPGPPYAPQIWSLGGRPKVSIDIPVTAVFLVLFIISAAAHMTILLRNNKKGHKFIMSGLLFGFSMARITTSVMRIASVSLPHDVPLAIAANIFTAAGVIIIYIINLILTRRILRASHPNFGWHKLVDAGFKALIASIFLVIIMVITVVIQSFYTLNPNIRRIDRDVSLTGSTYFAVIAFLPIPAVIAGLLLPRHQKLDKFGRGHWTNKIIIILASTTLISFGAIYRAVTSFQTPVPLTKPMPAYFHRGAFYVANFGVEIIVLYMYAIFRVDQRFHIPNGAEGYGSYSQSRADAPRNGSEASFGGDVEKQEDFRNSVNT